MKIRTKTEPYWYIHQLRGVLYVSWVSEKDRIRAAEFELKIIDKWIKLLFDMTGFELEGIK